MNYPHLKEVDFLGQQVKGYTNNQFLVDLVVPNSGFCFDKVLEIHRFSKFTVMNKLIDTDVLKEHINLMINSKEQHDLNGVLELIEALENEAKKYEELKCKKDYEADLQYRQAIIKRVKNKRILPTFKGETLHKFKNELHTMKQIMGMSNWGDTQNALFDIFALEFATWGGYHFHPEETKTQDAPVIEN